MSPRFLSFFQRFVPVGARGVVLLPLVLLVVIVAACARTAAQPAPPPPARVSVVDVNAESVTEWVEFTGRLEAVNTVEVRPRVSGFVSGVRFHEGALVRRGELLFQIDQRPFQAQADRLRAELARANATAQRAASELERAARLAAENAISREEQDRRAAFAEESLAQVTAAEAALRAAELDLEFTRVVSPIDGRVGRAIVTEGNLVSAGPGPATLLTTVVSLDPIYAMFDVDEQTYLQHSRLARLDRRSGERGGDMTLRVALANDSEFSRTGAINFLDNQLDPSTGTIRVRARLSNQDGSLTPGLFVRLRMPGATAQEGIRIPDRAIGTDLDKRFVYVVSPASAIEYRAVTLGPVVDGMRVIRSGLRSGDRVVVEGLQRVRPGAPVDAVPVSQEPRS